MAELTRYPVRIAVQIQPQNRRYTDIRRATSRGRALTRIRRRRELLNPPPSRSIPILIGGNGVQRTLRPAADHADIWHGFGRPTDLAERHRILDAWCAEVGITLFTLVAQGPVMSELSNSGRIGSSWVPSQRGG